ncbi:gag-polypeptide of LTR copia-type [Gracilaria domingensis]|nr:gag-polypeptide of LTR copia-type [Gracilaria domingensis]
MEHNGYLSRASERIGKERRDSSLIVEPFIGYGPRPCPALLSRRSHSPLNLFSTVVVSSFCCLLTVFLCREMSSVENDMSSLVDIQKVKLPVLNSSNYFMWSKKIQLVLKSKGLWSIVSGVEQAPDITDDVAHKRFSRRRDTALSTILLLVDESCVAPVLEMDEPHEVWATLRDQYQSVSQASRDSLLDTYQAMKMKTEETVLQFRARLSELESHLGCVGYAVSDSEKLRALLRGLKPEYDVTAEVIRGMDKSLPDGIALLIAKEASLSISQESRETSVKALNAKHGSRKRKGLKCYHCGRLGHKKVDCFDNPDSKKYRPKQNGRFDGEGDEARRVENSNVVRALIAGSSVASSRKWYVDSGATVHMCNDREHFAGQLYPSTKESVEIGDGNKLQIEGQGAVPCQAVVLGNRFDVHLTNFQYVPDLKCNLISVGALQSRGYKVLFDSDTHARKLCKVLDGTSGEVVLLAVGNLSSGLYEVLLFPNGCLVAPTSGTLLREPYA